MLGKEFIELAKSGKLDEAASSGVFSYVIEDDQSDIETTYAALIIDAPRERVWEVVSDFPSHKHFMPFVTKIRSSSAGKDKLRVHTWYKFKVAFFGFGFDVDMTVDVDAPESMLLREYHGGTFKRVDISHRLFERGPNTTMLVSSYFADVRSLGLLMKFVVQHHPELEAVAIGLIPHLQVMAIRDEVYRRAG